MTDKNEQRLMLNPLLTRMGLNEVSEADLSGGLGNVISHIGLTSEAFTPSAEQISLPGEFQRFPVKDAEKVDNKDHPQQTLFVPVQYGEENTLVRGIGFYLPSGTLLASYSTKQIEFYLVAFIEFKFFIHLLLKGLPADSLTVVSTGTVFNPGLREFMEKSEEADFNLTAGQLSHHNQLGDHDDQLTAEHKRNNQQDAKLQRHEKAIKAKDSQIGLNAYNLQWLALMFANEIEMIRSFLRELGQDGAFKVKSAGGWDGRNYPEGQTDATAYADLNKHSHWDHFAVNGIAQMSWIVGGIYFQLKHTDYSRRMPLGKGGEYLGSRAIDYPVVQPDVKGTVEQQVAKMQQYILAREDESLRAGLVNFRDSTIVYMAYAELYPEYEGAADLDSILATRHALTAESFSEAVEEFRGWNWTGLQDPIQNYSALSSIELGIDEATGQVIKGVWKPRVLMAPIGSYEDYPLHKILKKREDVLTSARTSPYSRRERFEVDPELLREMVSKIPGLDGFGAHINVPFQVAGRSETYYVDKWKKPGAPLNQAYYHDRYTLREKDADGRVNKHIGFSRSSFVAHNTRPEIIPVKIGNKKTRISYLVPIELVVIDQRQKWNPHGLKNVTSTHSYGQYANAGKTAGDPLPGYWHRGILFYKTPAALYSAAGSTDPADTASVYKYATAANGNSVRVSPAGVPPDLPPIQGKRFKQRWMIHDNWEEGTQAYREIRQRAANDQQALFNLTAGQLSQHNELHVLREQLTVRIDGKTDNLRTVLDNHRNYTDSQLFRLIANDLSLINQAN